MGAPIPSLLDHADALRLEVAPRIALKRKSTLGQFMTSAPVATFMASMFPEVRDSNCRLLDPGAGLGALSCAFLDRWVSAYGKPSSTIQIDAYEIDDSLRAHLDATFSQYAQKLSLKYSVVPGDFIAVAARMSWEGLRPFTHAILNPPYKKINSGSEHRLILRHIGIETVNLYSAFVALSLRLMQPGGQLVAIVPRSFCNGPI